MKAKKDMSRFRLPLLIVLLLALSLLLAQVTFIGQRQECIPIIGETALRNEGTLLDEPKGIEQEEKEDEDRVLFDTIRHVEFDGLSHIGEDAGIVYGTALVPVRVRDEIMARSKSEKHVNTKFMFPPGYEQFADKPTCRWCTSKSECIDGESFFTWGSEENMGGDAGQQAQGKAFVRETYSSLTKLGAKRQPPSFVTLVFQCNLAQPIPQGKAGRTTILIDNWAVEAIEISVKQPLPGDTPKLRKMEFSTQARFDVAKVERNPFFEKPVVCGRQLFGDVDARFIARLVEWNNLFGLERMVLYETGNSKLWHSDVLQKYLASGQVTIVDLRSELQRLYGYAGGIATIATKAAAQWLTRIDCLFRMKQLKPSWLLFTDLDEYILPALHQPAGLNFAAFLSKIPPEKNVVTVPVREGSATFCEENYFESFDSQKFRDEMLEQDKRIAEGKEPARKSYSNKYAIRPTSPWNGLRIHIVAGVKNAGIEYKEEKVPEQSFYLVHNRCVAFPRERTYREELQVHTTQADPWRLTS